MLDPAQQQILARGAAAWNQWRAEHSGVLVKLSSSDLSGADLQGVNLEGADLSTTRFREAILTGANLRGADISHAKFDKAQLDGADLTGVKSFMTRFYGAYCKDAKFGGSLMKWADFSDAYLGHADFTDARLEGGRFPGATLSSAVLDRAWIEKASFISATLEDASLRETVARKCDFGGASLFRADLDHADLRRAQFTRANLKGASFRHAVLAEADLSHVGLRDPAWLTIAIEDARRDYYYDEDDYEDNDAQEASVDFELADLSQSSLRGAQLEGANFAKAILRSANLVGANLTDARLVGADMRECNLERSVFVNTDFDGALMTGSRVYGISVWDIRGKVKEQLSLTITPQDESAVTVDNLEVAQFVYLMLHNQKIRGVIDTIGRKGVLILGRFTEARKAVLDALRQQLRHFDLVPIVFDWDKPTTRDLTETVQLLANMSRFVVADVTDAKSIPQELSHILPFLPSVPVRPIILAGQLEYAMFEHWTGYSTMLPVFEYQDQDHLVGNIEQQLLGPVEEWEAGYDKTKALERASREKDKVLRDKERQLATLRAENEALKKQRETHK